MSLLIKIAFTQIQHCFKTDGMFMQCIAIFSHEIYLKRRIDAAFF